MILERIVVGPLEANCYLFGDEKEVIIIDHGAEYKKVKKEVDKLGLMPKAIVNTHGHADHIGGNSGLGLPVWIHELDKEFLAEPARNLSGMFGARIKSQPATRLLADGDILRVGGLEIQVIHTPGHTPGGISLRHKDIIFTGDTLFRGGVGRTDFPYGSEKDLLRSIREKLLIYEDAAVYPGHGPQTTIAWEREHNPFLI